MRWRLQGIIFANLHILCELQCFAEHFLLYLVSLLYYGAKNRMAYLPQPWQTGHFYDRHDKNTRKYNIFVPFGEIFSFMEQIRCSLCMFVPPQPIRAFSNGIDIANLVYICIIAKFFEGKVESFLQ